MTTLSLDCLTLTDTLPVDLIRSASLAGFDLVSIWVNPPAPFPRQVVTPAMEKNCAALLADTGMRVHSLEVFDLVSEEQVRACRAAFDLGARLGGKAATAIHNTNPDRAHVVELLSIFAELAREYGLGVNIEPIAMGKTRTLADARNLIRDAGVDAGILFDTYHLVRSGSGVDDIRAIEPGLIRYVQINDGPADVPAGGMGAEAGGERLYPGDGVFPLVELLRATSKNVPWALETPSRSRAQRGVPPEAQAREGMAALRRLLDAVNSSPT